MYKKPVALLLALILVLSLTVPTMADEETADEIEAVSDSTEKQEVIYVNLDEGGKLSGVSVVNIFDIDQPCIINDYGRYSSVRNMTSNEPVVYKDGKVSIMAQKGKLYYEGTLEDPEIPWDISVRYYLDGKEMSARDIAGKSGKARVLVNVTRNESCTTSFFENFTIEASVSFDTEKCTNIKSDGATMANVGKNKQLSFILLPNQESEIEITMDTTSFAMSSFAFNGIQLSIDLDDDMLESDTMDEKIDELTDAVAELDDGVQELLDGVIELDDGVQELLDGVEELDDGVGKLRQGVRKLNSGASDAADGGKELSDGLATLSSKSASLNGGAKQVFDKLCASAMSSLNDGFSQINANIPMPALQITPIESLTCESYTDVLNAKISEIKGKKAAAQGYGADALVPYYDMLIASIEDDALASLDSYNTFYTGLCQYTGGVDSAASGAYDLAGGLKTLSDGVDELYDGTGDLKDGTKELRERVRDDLKDGTSELVDGVQELKDGTGEFRDKTKDLKGELRDKIEEAIDEILGKEIDLESFTSEENDKIDSVQFVIKTPEIKVPEQEAPEAAEEPELNFWQKLFKLFGITI